MLLEMRGISKSFPGVRALTKVDFTVAKGEIHALVGENGAGKSTLMKILGGVYRADAGEIYLEGEKIQLKNPLQAARLGIALVHQEFNLVYDMSVMENILLGQFPVRTGLFVDYTKLKQRAERLLDRVGQVRLEAPVRDLTVAEMQIVEIAKGLSYNPKVLVMDEPTAALNGEETRQLFSTMRSLKRQGVAIIYISHRLDEVMEVSDSLTVLRDGKRVASLRTAEVNKDEIIRMMVGRELTKSIDKQASPSSEPVLTVEGLFVPNRLRNIAFSLHRSEVVGVAGLMGAGQNDLAKSLFGILPFEKGEIRIKGDVVRITSPQEAIAHGIGWVTENRKEEGLVLSQSVMENISLASLRNVVGKGGFFEQPKELALATQYIRDLSIKTPDPNQIARQLSGGNQQKVVLAKWLATLPDIMVLSEPTRGVDVAAKRDIFKIIDSLAQEGKGILMFSSELEELLSITDRILVMYQGELRASLVTKNTSQEEIMYYATGGKEYGQTIPS